MPGMQVELMGAVNHILTPAAVEMLFGRLFPPQTWAAGCFSEPLQHLSRDLS